MLSWLTNLFSNPWFGFIALVVGVVATWITYRWSRKDKLPCYAIRNTLLIEDAKSRFPNLKVHYSQHGDDLENLSVAVIVFWNAGGETIHGSDIVLTEPLKIVAKDGCKILEAEIIQVNQPANQFQRKIAKSKQEATLTFDYIDKDQGAVIQVFHTGTSRHDLVFRGTMKGVRTIRCVELGNLPSIPPFGIRRKRKASGKSRLSRKETRHLFRRMFFVGFLFFLLPLLLYLWKLPPFDWRIVNIDGEEVRVISSFESKLNDVFAVFFGVFSLCYLFAFCYLSSSQPPKGLEKYEEHD